jgi:hypothetical protein
VEDRIGKFLDLSAILTGRRQKLKIALAGEHLGALDAILPKGTMDELLAKTFDDSNVTRQATAIADVLQSLQHDPKFGEVVEKITLLWYTGTCYAFSPAWQAANVALPGNTNRVVSVAAYETALQWTIGESHAPGSFQPGYESWSTDPHLRII